MLTVTGRSKITSHYLIFHLCGASELWQVTLKCSKTSWLKCQVLMLVFLIDWLIDFNCIFTFLGLSYVYSWIVHQSLHFLCSCFLWEVIYCLSLLMLPFLMRSTLLFIAGLRNDSKRVWTPIVLIHSLLNIYPWERYIPPYPSRYELNSITAVLLEGWLWH